MARKTKVGENGAVLAGGQGYLGRKVLEYLGRVTTKDLPNVRYQDPS